MEINVEDNAMITFIMRGIYSDEALESISAARTEQAAKIVQDNGGRMVSAYATMGDVDLLAVMEFPGVNEAFKASVELGKTLGVAFSTVPAVSVEEFDKLIG